VCVCEAGGDGVRAFKTAGVVVVVEWCSNESRL